MSATNLVVEILVIGIQVFLWGVLGLETVGFNVVDVLTDKASIFKDYWIPVSFIILALTYTIGAVFDKLSAWVEDKILYEKWKSTAVKEKEVEAKRVSAKLLIKGQEPFKTLTESEYLVRLFRSTTANTLIILFIYLCGALPCIEPPYEFSFLVFSFLTVFLVLAFLSWKRAGIKHITLRYAVKKEMALAP